MIDATQAVRDLLWVVNSPSFVTGADVAPSASLSAGEIDADALAAFLADRSAHRVGHYFEALLHFWLDQVCDFEILDAGQTIKDGKRTIGELDFVYRNHDDHVVHCEASVKFFLHHPRPDTSDFPGPNATDNYERKINRLFDHQLEVSRIHRPEVELRHAFVKGMVFWRDGAGATDERPDRMPTEVLSGRWLPRAELDTLRGADVTHAALAHKPHWLAPCLGGGVEPVGDLCDQIDQHFDNASRPLLVSLRDGVEGGEVERVFVVSDTWPNNPATNDV